MELDESCTYPHGYTLNENGVYHHNTRICGPLAIDAYVRSPQNDSWGKRLRFNDPDGKEHTVVCANSDLSSGSDVLRGLMDKGLYVCPAQSAKQHLVDFIQLSKPLHRVRITDKCGWHDDGKVFVLPNRTIGETSDEYQFEAKGGVYR